jgi:hypothetical protein
MRDVSKRINQARASARGITVEALTALPCPTCTRPAGAPYRRHDARGIVVEGCVDAHHTAWLVRPSESARWHDREAARGIRAAHLASIR